MVEVVVEVPLKSLHLSNVFSFGKKKYAER